jgi:uncharacterized protein (DUF1501 family)
MTMNHDKCCNSRRHFLRMGAFATAAGFSRFGMMNALAQSASDYKALVCIFLFGGNDSHNMVVPQSQSAYNAYKAIRGRWRCQMSAPNCFRSRQRTELPTR